MFHILKKAGSIIYLKVFDFLGNGHREREEPIEAADQRKTDGLKDKLMAQRVHPLSKILWVLGGQQLTVKIIHKEHSFHSEL